jgi:anhydro-N-acetylmuramic acid kinase
MKESRMLVGLMTGTSIDAIDAALVELSGSGAQSEVSLRHFVSIPFPAEVQAEIYRVASGRMITAGELSQLNFLLGTLYSEAVLRLCREAKLELAQIDLIGSHGQTVYHQSEPTLFCGRRVVSTLQIGEPSILAENTGVTVVADFRPRDMAAGGKGAPLIPYVDYLLFRHAQKGRVLLNIGGIANLTAIPAAGHPHQIKAFDTGPGNMVIDALVRHFTQGEKKYDTGGRMARSGKVIQPLLEKLLEDPFFRQRPPKSAGREQFGEEFADRFLSCSGQQDHEDLICTATELTAVSVAQAINHHVQPQIHVDQLLVSGGGAHNEFLLQRLATLLPKIELCATRQMGIPVEAKEAVGFALLANETFNLTASNVPNATGARHPVILGKVICGNNYARLRGKSK